MIRNAKCSLYSPVIIQTKEGDSTKRNMETLLLQGEEKLIENEKLNENNAPIVTSVSTGIASSKLSLETNKMADILLNISESLNQSNLPSLDNRNNVSKINCSLDTDETTMHTNGECLRQTIHSRDLALGEGITYRETHESAHRTGDVETSSLLPPVSGSGEVESILDLEVPYLVLLPHKSSP